MKKNAIILGWNYPHYEYIGNLKVVAKVGRS